MVRLGVFSLGQFWFVVGAEGAQRGFRARDAAVDAAGGLLSLHRAGGESGELLVQDDVGRLMVVRSEAAAPAAAIPAVGGISEAP